MQNQDDIQQIHTKIQTITPKMTKKCKNRTITLDNKKHDKNTEYKTTLLKENIIPLEG